MIYIKSEQIYFKYALVQGPIKVLLISKFQEDRINNVSSVCYIWGLQNI